MVADAGKTIAEADPEVSEAIDFCEFYPLTAVDLEPTIDDRNDASRCGRGDHSLELSTCDSVRRNRGGFVGRQYRVLKPASESVLPAWLLCQAFWDAGVPGRCSANDSLSGIRCRTGIDLQPSSRCRDS